MSDETQYIKSLQDFILNLLTQNVNEKEKTEYYVKTLMRYSFLENMFSKFIFKYRSKEYDLLNLMLFVKENSEPEGISDGLFEAVKTMFEEVSKELVKIGPLFFYGKLMKDVLNFPKKLKIGQNNFKEFSQEDAEDKIENMLKDHIEVNFFGANDSSKKIDNHYFNENYIKQATDRLNFEYSVSALRTAFKLLERFEIQNLICKDPELLVTTEEGMISEKKLFNYLDKTNKEIKYSPKNLALYLIESHLTRITQEVYDAESVVNNYEIENQICFSLFLIRKIIKDYSFYFDKKPELERIFLEVKKFKE
jgi:hypothetical protein